MAQKKLTAKGTVRWVGRFRPPGGKESSRSFATRKEAKAWETEQFRSHRRGVWVDPVMDKLTVYELYSRWSDRPARENSRLVYAQVLKNLGPIGDIYARQLTRTDVDMWYRMLITARPWFNNEALSPRVARSMVGHLSAAMTMGVEEEWVGRNPVKIPRLDSADIVRVKDIPTPDDIRRIVDLLRAGGAIYERKENGKIKTKKAMPAPMIADMVLVGVGTGARISELCGFDVSDVYLSSTPPPTVDLLHWSKVTDFRTVLSKSGIQCTDSEFGTNEEKGWDYLRCETSTDSITAIMHDEPESYISSQYEENINADKFTFVYGENWVASCMGDLPKPCWGVLAGVTGSTLMDDEKAWISMGNDEVREIPKPV